jgi:uncharacterized protein
VNIEQTLTRRGIVNRVTRTALTLARSLNPVPDLFIVELSAILHDLFDKKYNPPSESAGPGNPDSGSETATYRQFLPFFQKVQTEHGVDLISSGRATLIAKVVENVSWTTEAKLRKEDGWGEWHEVRQRESLSDLFDLI